MKNYSWKVVFIGFFPTEKNMEPNERERGRENNDLGPIGKSEVI